VTAPDRPDSQPHTAQQSPPMVCVRPARPEDIPAMVRFNFGLVKETEGASLDPSVLQKGIELALADPQKARYFVAECDGKPVGQTMITYEWSDWRCGWVWWIQSVYVDPAYRQRGVFRALYEYVREAARREGAVGLRLYVRDDNPRARTVYQRLGMKPSGYSVFEEMFVPLPEHGSHEARDARR